MTNRLLLNSLLKKWFPNTLNVVVFIFAFSFVSFCLYVAVSVWHHDTHYKRHIAWPNNALQRNMLLQPTPAARLSVSLSEAFPCRSRRWAMALDRKAGAAL